jgi:hypothetical protein
MSDPVLNPTALVGVVMLVPHAFKPAPPCQGCDPITHEPTNDPRPSDNDPRPSDNNPRPADTAPVEDVPWYSPDAWSFDSFCLGPLCFTRD